MKISGKTVVLSISKANIENLKRHIRERMFLSIIFVLSLISITAYIFYYKNGLGLAYNDARSHLDIGRRVVEGLKTGLAQLGSVWLPLPHLLMVPTIWNDFMWHSGLAGAIQSMISFVGASVVIYSFLKKLKVGMFGRLFAVLIFVSNINILYLQSTAMTELLLLATMTAGSYFLMRWAQTDNFLDLIKSSFWIMLSSLTRYDGWFLLFFATLIITVEVFRKKGYKTTEGVIILFCTMGAVGIGLWFLWNLLIFKDPLYFAFGPFSAHEQQTQMEAAGNLDTKGNLLFSTQIYLYALIFNSYALTAILGMLGAIKLWKDKYISTGEKVTSLALIAPLFFNILALYLGHSVLFIQGIGGNTWFNVRYGIMILPAIAIFSGFLVDRLRDLRWIIIGLFSFMMFFVYANADAVTIDDALVGSSQKNVTEVSGWLKENAADEKGFILISAASHDAIIFSSGLPMKRFIHEGTGKYWESAVDSPDRWARWIVMRTYDESDMTYREIKDSPGYEKFVLVDHYPFADIYELKPEYIKDLNTEPILGKQK